MNKCSEQSDFFTNISEELNGSFTLSDFSVIVGGDFNVIFDQELDGKENERLSHSFRRYLFVRETLYVASNYSKAIRLLIDKRHFAG